MEGRRPARYRRTALRARRFRRDRRGVVSVVGTLLSLLVFFALFGVFLTQYLPLWMLQNEGLFVSQAQASLETLKQSVDDQAIFGAPQTYSVAFTMNSQGIPLFAQPTQGALQFFSGGCSGGFTSNATAWYPVNVGACAFQHLGFWTGPGTSGVSSRQPVNLTSVSSYLQMTLPNRYFPSEKLYFENDAVLATQSGSQQLVLAAPPLNISVSGSNATFSTSFVQLAGFPAAAATQGTKNVYSSLISNTSYSSFGRFVKTTTTPNTPLAFNASYSIGTVNVCAWYRLLSGIVNTSGIAKGVPSGTAASAVLYILGPSGVVPYATNLCLNAAGKTYDVTLTIYNLSYAVAYAGVSQITFTAGGL